MCMEGMCICGKWRQVLFSCSAVHVESEAKWSRCIRCLSAVHVESETKWRDMHPVFVHNSHLDFEDL